MKETFHNICRIKNHKEMHKDNSQYSITNSTQKCHKAHDHCKGLRHLTESKVDGRQCQWQHTDSILKNNSRQWHPRSYVLLINHALWLIIANTPPFCGFWPKGIFQLCDSILSSRQQDGRKQSGFFLLWRVLWWTMGRSTFLHSLETKYSTAKEVILLFV